MRHTAKDSNVAKENGNSVEARRFYRFVIDSLPIAILTVNSKFKITSCNPWAEEVTGYSKEAALGQYCGEILQGGMCQLNCPLRTVVKRENPIVRIETTIQNKRGETIPVRMNTAGLFDDEDNLIGAVEAFQDISYLKALEREKSNIVSMFAHDMKSSLTIIGGFLLRLIKKGADLDGEKHEKYLDILRKETGKLDFLVNDFLEFSRIQSGKLKLIFGPTSLDKELMELFEAYQARASQSAIRLELHNEDELPIVKADANRLRRVFTNLLDNAFKFSKEGGKVIVSTHETDEDILIQVEDQGVGINPNDLPYIFDPFHQGRIGDKIEGFGLGLAAVKTIVEGHGGSVHVESTLGKGSIFTVALPKDRD